MLARQVAYIRQLTISLIKVKAITDYEHIADREPVVIRLYLSTPSGRLVEQRTNLNTLWISAFKISFEIIQRHAGIDYILYYYNTFSLDAGRKVFIYSYYSL